MTWAVVMYCALYCAVSAVASQAPTFTIVANFNDAVQDPGPLIQGADGNFYGWANTANTVSVTLGSKPATVYGAALAPGYAGLYRLANGDYPLAATVSGVQSPSTTLITVQK